MSQTLCVHSFATLFYNYFIFINKGSVSAVCGKFMVSKTVALCLKTMWSRMHSNWFVCPWIKEKKQKRKGSRVPSTSFNSGHTCLGVALFIIAIHFCTVLLTLTSQGFKRVQNQLARLLTKSPLFTRSLPLLRSLHWLPVRFRILF